MIGAMWQRIEGDSTIFYTFVDEELVDILELSAGQMNYILDQRYNLLEYAEGDITRVVLQTETYGDVHLFCYDVEGMRFYSQPQVGIQETSRNGLVGKLFSNAYDFLNLPWKEYAKPWAYDFFITISHAGPFGEGEGNAVAKHYMGQYGLLSGMVVSIGVEALILLSLALPSKKLGKVAFYAGMGLHAVAGTTWLFNDMNLAWPPAVNVIMENFIYATHVFYDIFIN
ncbi:MAG: hypothetical protein NDI94_04970 [Candidatus Woesearchaeota archaeon]|nr:hypothetical protein [Candidatus Woesearchaeota archaeon]